MTKFSQTVLIAYAFFLIGLIGSVKAEPLTYGNWFVDVSKSGDFLYAATVNDSGNFFGQYCYPGAGSCMWFLGMPTGCKEGAQYPVLVNSDVGSSQLQLLCTGRFEDRYYRYAFTNFEAVSDIVTKGLRVGFALPLQSDQFSVIRFNLDGSNRALSVMHDAASRSTPLNVTPAGGRTGTRDEIM